MFTSIMQSCALIAMQEAHMALRIPVDTESPHVIAVKVNCCQIPLSTGVKDEHPQSGLHPVHHACKSLVACNGMTRHR